MGELTRRQRLLPCENATLWHKNSANFQPGSVGIMASYYQVQGWLNFILSSSCVNYGTEISTYRTSSAHEISPFVTKVTVSYKKWPETRVSFMCEVTSKYINRLLSSYCTDFPFSVLWLYPFLSHEASSGKKMYPLIKLANLILIIGTLLHKKILLYWKSFAIRDT